MREPDTFGMGNGSLLSTEALKFVFGSDSIGGNYTIWYHALQLLACRRRRMDLTLFMTVGSPMILPPIVY